MLTKEECEKSYANLSVIRELLNINGLLTNTYDKSMVTFARLINEHFDNPPTKCIVTIKFDKDDIEKTIHDLIENPPLKFEELKPNMWVWDNKIKEYRKIDRVNKKYHDIEFFNTYGWFSDFEENRFYRREVKDDAKDCD